MNRMPVIAPTAPKMPAPSKPPRKPPTMAPVSVAVPATRYRISNLSRRNGTMRSPVSAPVISPMAETAAAERGDLDGPADDETNSGTENSPRDCAAEGSEEETAHDPHQALSRHDAHQANASGNGGWNFV